MRDSQDGIGLAGWELSIQPAFGGAPITGVTDGTGWVRFNGLTPGVYHLSENPPTGWQSVGSSITQELELGATGSCALATFENHQETISAESNTSSKDDTTKAGSVKSDAPKKHRQAKHCRAKYTVQWGNTLFSIAQFYNTTVKKLAQVNHLKNPSLIYPGQVLCIR